MGQLSLDFSNLSSNPISHGANALKLENEVISENSNETVNDDIININEELLKIRMLKV